MVVDLEAPAREPLLATQAAGPAVVRAVVLVQALQVARAEAALVVRAQAVVLVVVLAVVVLAAVGAAISRKPSFQRRPLAG